MGDIRVSGIPTRSPTVLWGAGESGGRPRACTFVSRMPASRPPATLRQLPGLGPEGDRRHGPRSWSALASLGCPEIRGAPVFRLIRGPGRAGPRVGSGQRALVNERIFWTPCSVEGWGKQWPSLVLILGSERVWCLWLPRCGGGEDPTRRPR